MKTFETKFDGGDGLAFFVRGWEPEGNPKAVIALVHGLGEHTGRYAHVAEAMTEAGYAMVGFDLRGHGKSGGARGNIPSLDVAMQDIRRFFRLLTERYPALPQFLYGHSLGGMLSLAYAIQHGKGLKGVIVTGAGFRSPLQKQKAKVAIAGILGSLTPSLILSSGLDPATISRDQDVVQKYVNDPLVHDKISAGLGKTMLTGIDFCFAHVKEFSLPLLIMHGRDDRLVYPSGSEDFAKLAGETNKDVTLKLWEGMYHEIHNEPEQAEVFKVMIDWLDGHL
ncbi:MAG: lysophospholipase [Anaerolineales bacterium]|nr:alpha/beta hydrolase [Anaerolineae bacterium]PWB73495.1 MAG: lysophospholipase [Anaerolineales bacterium]